MKKTLPIAISSGLIASIWVTSSVNYNLATFAGFLAWSTFFATGAGINGYYKTMFSNLSGIFWGLTISIITTLLSPVLGPGLSMGLATAFGSSMVIFQNKFISFSYIPGIFIGISAYFINSNLKSSIIAMIIGASLGIISEKFSYYLEKNKIFE